MPVDSQYPNQEDLVEFKKDTQTWRGIVRGGDTTVVTDGDGGQHDSVEKFYKDQEIRYGNTAANADRAEAAAELAMQGDKVVYAETLEDLQEIEPEDPQTPGVVWNDPNDTEQNPINGNYVWDGSAWEWSGVQPERAGIAKRLVAPLRIPNMCPDPAFATGLPKSREAAERVAISDSYLNALGVFYGASGVSVTSFYGKYPVDPAWLGRHVIMAFVKYNASGASDAGTGAQYLTTGTTLVNTGLSYRTVRLTSNNVLYVATGKIPDDAGITALAIGTALGTAPSANCVALVSFAVSDAPIDLDSFEWDIIDSIRAAPFNALAATVAQQGEELTDVAIKTSGIPPAYVRNYEPNGNFRVPTAWSKTPSNAAYEDVTSIPELAELGIKGAYKIVPPSGGNAASRFDTNDSTIGNLAGAQPGDNIMIGSLLYASDGVTYPTASSLSAFVIRQDGTLRGNDEWGFVQVNSKVRFYWARFNGLVGQLTAVTIGWNASASTFPDAPGVTRYHSGLFVTYSPDVIPTPTAANFVNYTAWEGELSSDEFFDGLNDLLAQQGSSPAPTLLLGGAGLAETAIQVRQGANILRRALTPFQASSLTASSALNFRKDQVDDLLLRGMNDDAAPLHAFGTTIGANHGYVMTNITATAHGKTSADIGSVYSNGGNEYVLVGVPDANHVYMTARSSNGATPTGTLTYVSGGSSSSNIVGSNAAGAALHPAFNNRTMRVLVDGVEVVEKTANLRFSRNVTFAETYDLLFKNYIVEWYVSTGGVGDYNAIPGALRVTNNYQFWFDGTLIMYAAFEALQDSIPLTDIMVLQAIAMADGVDGTVRYAVPKALPFTFQSTDYDFANGEDASVATGWSGRLLFTPTRCEPDGILADTFLQMTDNYCFAMGLLPEHDAGVSERRVNCTVSAMEIRNGTRKVYFRGVDKGDITLNKGDTFNFVAYRNLVPRAGGRTAAFPVRTNSADYFHVYWHDFDGTDAVPLPEDFAGREFEIVEASANVTLVSRVLSGTLTVDVSAAGSNGYLRIKVAR